MEAQSVYSGVRSRILNEMIEEVRNKAPYLLMVVDSYTINILSNATSVLDLTSKSITVIEKLEKSRQPLTDFEALYFVSVSSVDLLIQDFQEKPKYKAAHLCFTGKVEDADFRKLAASSLAAYVKSFKEVNCDVRVLGANTFSLEETKLLGPLYLGSPSRNHIIKDTASRLAHLCVMLKEFPYICYHANSQCCKELAVQFEDKIESIYRSNPELRFEDNRATLLVLDRKFDVATPLAHDVHYEAMLKDLFVVGADGKVKYEALENGLSVKKDAYLNENDQVWTQLRYEEIDDASTVLSQELQRYREQYRDVEMASKGVEDLKVASKVVSNLPEYNEKINQYSVNQSMIDMCLRAFTDEGIMDLSEIEQILMTGVDTFLKEVSTKKILKRVVNKLQELNSPKQKLRLVLLVVTTLEIGEKDRKELTQFLEPSQLFTITKLNYLGINPQTQNKKSTKRIDKAALKEFRNRMQQIQKYYCYAIPKISDIIQSALDNNIDSAQFEFGKTRPQQGNSTGVSLRRKAAPSKRIIVFVLGGVSWAELRLVKDFPSVIIGGSRVMAPSEFIEEVDAIAPQAENADPRDVSLQFDFR